MILPDISSYVTEKADAAICEFSNYVSTESMLPNRGGITTPSSLPNAGKVTVFKAGDVLLSNIRPYFKKTWLANRDGLCSGDVLVFRKLPDAETTPEFLYALISSDEFISYDIATSKGTKMPRGDKAALMKYEFTTLMPDDQVKVGYFLSLLNRKMSLNTKINDYLEELAMTLYEEMLEWNDLELPSGWTMRTLSEFFPVRTGKKDANIATKNGRYPFYTCSQGHLLTDNYSFDGSAILVAGNGDFNVKWYEGKFEAYQRTYVLMPDDPKLTGFLYCAVKRNLEKITSGARGSVIKFITKGNIADCEIAVPPNPESNSTIVRLNAFLHTIDSCKREIKSLAELRDTLLPKLMSGEIDVSQVELTQLNNHLGDY